MSQNSNLSHSLLIFNTQMASIHSLFFQPTQENIIGVRDEVQFLAGISLAALLNIAVFSSVINKTLFM